MTRHRFYVWLPRSPNQLIEEFIVYMYVNVNILDTNIRTYQAFIRNSPDKESINLFF